MDEKIGNEKAYEYSKYFKLGFTNFGENTFGEQVSRSI
jgi:hypothetical protein